MVFATVHGDVPPLGRETKTLWRRIAVHLAQVARLVGRDNSTDPAGVELGVDDKEEAAHAEGAARDGALRDQVLCSVQAIDRARTRAGRSNPVEALDLW